MAREVEWTESASDDLAEVAGYIAKDSEFYAAAVVRELIEAGRSLVLLAERGRVVPEYRDTTIRELPGASVRSSIVNKFAALGLHVDSTDTNPTHWTFTLPPVRRLDPYQHSCGPHFQR